jgi:NAD(P) transhydrogenase
MPTLRGRIEHVRDVLQEAAAHRFVPGGIAYRHGIAQLEADHTVHIATPDGLAREVAARAVLVATGSRPTHYPGIAFDDPDVYDSDEIYSLRTVPKDVVIRPDQRRVRHRVHRSWYPGQTGQQHRSPAAEHRRRTGWAGGRRVPATPSPAGSGRQRGRRQARRRPAQGHALDWNRPGCGRRLGRRRPHAQHRRARLEQAGVRIDARGRILVDRYYRTTAPGIYAAGDVVKPALASNAMQQGGAAAAYACGLVFGVEIDQTASGAVYGLPEVASVGATEEQIRAAGIPYAVGRCDLATTPRGAIAGHGGLLKLIFRADTRKLLGVHCFGDIASEVVGLGHVVLQLGGRVELFLTLALNTPTYSYAYHDATVDGLTRLTKRMSIAESGAPLARHSDGGNTRRRMWSSARTRSRPQRVSVPCTRCQSQWPTERPVSSPQSGTGKDLHHQWQPRFPTRNGPS